MIDGHHGYAKITGEDKENCMPNSTNISKIKNDLKTKVMGGPRPAGSSSEQSEEGPKIEILSDADSIENMKDPSTKRSKTIGCTGESPMKEP